MREETQVFHFWQTADQSCKITKTRSFNQLLMAIGLPTVFVAQTMTSQVKCVARVQNMVVGFQIKPSTL
jgi:hypothetical protein